MKSNRNFKDSVFTSLFSDPAVLKELYCALENVSLPADVPVSINTLKDAFVKDIHNDISFIVGSKLVVLIEHQSTINPNMPLRLLAYIAESYKRMIKGKELYKEKRVKIPWPEFFVLYNGIDPYPERKILRLSEMFEEPQDLGLPEKLHPLLELEVKVLNINDGKNREIANRSENLNGYAIFIARAREYWKEYGDLLRGIKEAVKYCKKHGILKEYLEEHETEVINMLFGEWNMDTAMEVRYEEGFEDGVEQGHAEGKAEGHNEVITLLDQGLSINEIKQRLTQTN